MSIREKARDFAELVKSLVGFVFKNLKKLLTFSDFSTIFIIVILY